MALILSFVGGIAAAKIADVLVKKEIISESARAATIVTIAKIIL